MALSPSIPTSFVPKQPVTPNRRRSTGNNIFLIISLVIAGVALVVALGVFLFATYLKSVEKSKGDELIAAQAHVSPDTVEQFVRLRDRFAASQTILNQHVTLSQFFTLLEGVTLQGVRFTSLSIQVADDRSAKIDMAGTARSFNALASESTNFASQQYIKSAIFSGIAVNKDGTVSFSLTATLDPRLITESAVPATPAILSAPAASSTIPAHLPTVTQATSTGVHATSTATTTKP